MRYGEQRTYTRREHDPGKRAMRRHNVMTLGERLRTDERNCRFASRTAIFTKLLRALPVPNKPSQYFRAGNFIPQQRARVYLLLCQTPFLVPCCCWEGASSVPVAPAARAWPNSRSMRRHREAVHFSRRVRATMYPALGCRGAREPARDRTLSGFGFPASGFNLLPRRSPANRMDFESARAHAFEAADSCFLCHASQIVQTECRQRLAVLLKSLENLGRTSHDERLAMYEYSSGRQPMCVYISIM